MAAKTTTPDTMRVSSDTSMETVRKERWRLPLHHRNTLADLFQGTEETRAGLRTRYLPDGAAGQDDETPLHDLERYCDAVLSSDGKGFQSGNWRNQIERAHKTIDILHEQGKHDAVAILAAVYGHTDPSSRKWPMDAIRIMGELAPLVRYCEATEVVRVRMARERALEVAKNENAYSFIRARQVEVSELQALTSGDAIALAIDLHPIAKPKPCYCEPMVMHTARIEAWRKARNDRSLDMRAFLVEARVQCSAMLEAASRAYADVWQSLSRQRA